MSSVRVRAVGFLGRRDPNLSASFKHRYETSDGSAMSINEPSEAPLCSNETRVCNVIHF